MKPDIGHEYTNNAVCPKCGNEFRDSWEFEDGDDCECDCGANFTVQVNTSVTYSTKLIKPKKEAAK